MTITLQKGQRVNVELVRVGVGLGWQASQAKGAEYDLDATAFMLAANQKLPKDEFFIFYGLPAEFHLPNGRFKSPDGAIEHTGDDKAGGSGGDDETMLVDLLKVDQLVQEIIFCVSIHDAVARKQNFGQVRQSFVRLYDLDNNVELARYELDEDFSVETAVALGRLYRRNASWRFEALGHGYRGGLEELVSKYQ